MPASCSRPTSRCCCSRARTAASSCVPRRACRASLVRGGRRVASRATAGWPPGSTRPRRHRTPPTRSCRSSTRRAPSCACRPRSSAAARRSGCWRSARATAARVRRRRGGDARVARQPGDDRARARAPRGPAPGAGRRRGAGADRARAARRHRPGAGLRQHEVAGDRRVPRRRPRRRGARSRSRSSARRRAPCTWTSARPSSACASPIEPGQGLGAAVEAYARRVAADSRFALDLDIADEARDLRLDAEAEAQVYRIVQEALTNVRKHASARRVRVSMASPDGRLDLRDRGRRPRPRPAQPASGDVARYGLRSMHERAAGDRRDARRPRSAGEAGSIGRPVAAAGRSRRRPRIAARPVDRRRRPGR